MSFGKELLDLIFSSEKSRAAVEKEATIAKLKALGIPTPDKAYGHAPGQSEDDYLYCFSYEIGKGYEVGFDIGSDSELGIHCIGTPDDFLTFDDITEGDHCLAELKRAELKKALPDESDNKLFILAWIKYVHEDIRRRDDTRNLLEESNRILNRPWAQSPSDLGSQ